MYCVLCHHDTWIQHLCVYSHQADTFITYQPHNIAIMLGCSLDDMLTRAVFMHHDYKGSNYNDIAVCVALKGHKPKVHKG